MEGAITAKWLLLLTSHTCRSTFPSLLLLQTFKPIHSILPCLQNPSLDYIFWKNMSHNSNNTAKKSFSSELRYFELQVPNLREPGTQFIEHVSEKFK